LAPLECAQPCTSALALNDDDDDDDEELDKAPTPLTTNYTALEDGGHGTTTNAPGAMNTSVSSLPSYRAKKPARGTRVDSIAYYTQELAAHSRNLFRMQQRHASLAAKKQTGDDNSIISQFTDKHNLELTLLDQDQSFRLHPPTKKSSDGEHSGTSSVNPIGNLVGRVVRETSDMANQIMDDSVIDNALVSPSDAYYYDNEDFYSDEAMDNPCAAEARDTAINSSLYGSISGSPVPGDGNHVLSDTDDAAADDNAVPSQQRRARLMRRRGYQHPNEVDNNGDNQEEFDDRPYFDEDSDESDYAVPFANNQYRNPVRRFLGRLGLDFLVSVLRWGLQQVQVSLEGVVGESAPISRTGFVTFLDLASTTCAASAPLTVKAGVLNVSMAPEPRVSRIVAASQ
jgi:hypothetical protein